jgi:hypothetical protein
MGQEGPMSEQELANALGKLLKSGPQPFAGKATSLHAQKAKVI